MSLETKPDGKVVVTPRPDLLRRLQRTQMRMLALGELHQQLAVATELAEEFGDHGRQGIYRAIIALLDYCSSQGIPRATLYPLKLVAGALVDADRGVPTPAFTPDSTNGCPPLGHTEHEPRAQQAVVVECCIRQRKLDGAKAFRIEGAEEAARILRSHGWGAHLSAKKLLQLREEVTARPVGDPMRDVFDVLSSSPLARAMPLQWAKTLAEHGWAARRPKGPKVGI